MGISTVIGGGGTASAPKPKEYELLFVYDHLVNRTQLGLHSTDPSFHSICRLEEAAPAFDENGNLTLVRDQNFTSQGVVYKVRVDTFEYLDEIYVNQNFARSKFVVYPTPRYRHLAGMFNVNMYHTVELAFYHPPETGYVNMLREAYKEFNMPTDLIDDALITSKLFYECNPHVIGQVTFNR